MVKFILFHEGGSKYVDNCLINIKKNNFDYIFLNNPEIIDKYSKTWKEFEKKYKHFSTNDYINELRCFKRWFVIKEYCEFNEISKFWVLDSDVLLLKSFNSVKYKIEKKSNSALYFSNQNESNFQWSVAPHVGYWIYKDISEFVNFILHTYTKNLSVFDPKIQFHIKNKINGGINDMTLIYLFTKTKQKNYFQNIYEISLKNQIYLDMNFNTSEMFFLNEFKMNKFGTAKKIILKGEKIFFKNSFNKLCEVGLIHFSGKSKKYLSYYSNSNLFNSILFIFFPLVYFTFININKLWKKI